MKNLRALLTIATLFTLFSSFSSNAQDLGIKRHSNDTRLDVGISLGVPLAHATKSVDADIRFQKDFSPNVAGLLNVGFTYFLPSEVPLMSAFIQNMVFFPVRGGAKVFLTERVYVSGEVGAAFRKTSFSAASFLYSPGAGFEFAKGLDLALRYESYTKYDLAKVTFKVAYGFRFRQSKYSTWYQ